MSAPPMTCSTDPFLPKRLHCFHTAGNMAGEGAVPLNVANDQLQEISDSVCAVTHPARTGKSVEKQVLGNVPSEGCPPTAPRKSQSPVEAAADSAKPEKEGSPKAGPDTLNSPAEVPAERQLSPEKALRAARMRDRFADTILKAHEKTSNKVRGVRNG